MDPEKYPTPRRNRSQFGERRYLDLRAGRRAEPTIDLRPYGDLEEVRPSQYLLDLSADSSYLGYDELN